MATTKSQNGWPVHRTKPPLWAHPQVGGILAGPVWVVLAWYMREHGRWVESIDPSQSGCWNPRKISGSTKYSNHASATAVDLNWRKHPAGKRDTYTATQRNTIEALIAKADRVLRWGRLFDDEMHIEIAPGVTAAQVEKLASRLLQKALIARGYSCGPTGADGLRGKNTAAALTRFQTDHGLTVDGIDGPKTWAALTT